MRIYKKIKQNNYFFLSDNSEVLECDSIFDINDGYEFAVQFKRKYFEQKPHEYFIRKFSFFNEFIKVLFNFPFLEQVDFYVSTQYSIMLEDFKIKKVKEKNLLDAFLISLQPEKKDKFYGLKTCKFIVYQ